MSALSTDERVDLLSFTGSDRVGSMNAEQGAPTLKRVLLELGGKSPTVIAPDYPLKKAVERIMAVKLFNAGQICVDVDYLFVPEDKVTEFVGLARDWVKLHYPDINSRDFTSIIDQAAFEACYDSGEAHARVNELDAVRRERGIFNRPSFDINGQLLVGSQPFSVYEDYFSAAAGE